MGAVNNGSHISIFEKRRSASMKLKKYSVNGDVRWYVPGDEPAGAIRVVKKAVVATKVEAVEPAPVEPVEAPKPEAKARKKPANKSRKAGANK